MNSVTHIPLFWWFLIGPQMMTSRKLQLLDPGIGFL